MRWLPVAALALAGCTLGPSYERPDLDIPPAYRATADSAAAAWPAPDWWRNFHAPELDRLIERARAYNNDIAAAVARVVQADAQVRISGAPLLPSVNGTAGYTYQRIGLGNDRSLASSGHTYFDSHNYNIGLQASYDLDLFGKNRALAESAVASLIASRFDQQTVALAVVTSVASTYFQMLSGQDRLRIAENNLRDAEHILAAYRARVVAGTASALDVSQQEALVAGTRATLPSLRNTIDQNRIALGILVGLPPERLDVSGGSLDDLPLPVPAAGVPSELLGRRPDVGNAEAQLVAQNANIRSARAQFFPDISLTASGGLSSAALSALTGPGTLIAEVTASLVQPIFDNGLRRGQLDLAKGRYVELVADYRKAVLQAFTDVEQALAALQYTTEQEALERTAVDVARRSAAIAQAQLQAGTIDIITLLNTQQTLFTDLDQAAQIRLARFQALLNLYKALGGGFDTLAGTA